MRVLVIVRHILPFVVSFLRDRHRWIIAGRPVARTEEFHGQRAEELVAAIGTLGPGQDVCPADCCLYPVQKGRR